MKDIRALGFSHLISGVVGSPYNGCGLAATDIEVVTGAPVGARSLVGLAVQGNKLGFQVLENGQMYKRGVSSIRIGSLIGNRQDYQSITIGFRLNRGDNPAAALSYVGIGVLALTNSSNPDLSLISSNTAISGTYYEIEIRVYGNNPGFDLWADGIKISSGALPSTITAYWTQGSIKDRWIQLGSGNVEAYTSWNNVGATLFTLEDMYVSMTTVPGESCRLGPIKVVPLPVESVGSTPWVSSDPTKTPVEVLNLPDHHAHILNPVVVSEVTDTPLRVKPSLAGLSDSSKILAVTGATSARRAAGDSSTLGVKWSAAGVSLSAPVYTPTNGIWSTQKDVQIPNLLQMPNGTPITKESLAGLEMVLTPNA